MGAAVEMLVGYFGGSPFFMPSTRGNIFLQEMGGGCVKAFQEIKKELSRQVHERLDMEREMSDEEIGDVIDHVIVERSRSEYMDALTKLSLRQELFNAIRRLDILQILIDDADVTEIMVNGPDAIFYEKQGRLYIWDRHFESREKLEDVIQQIVARSGRYVNQASPIVDARLPDGSRVNVVLDPVAVNGPILTIRKFPKEPITMEDMIRWESISREAADYLKVLVMAGYNIFISGATSTGKTTFLNVLADYIPKNARIITIEDSAELQLHGAVNLVRLEAQQSEADSGTRVTIRDLIRTSLRMRPDRIIVGEVRGAEALDMVQAMNTGHDGSLSTGHANSPEDMLSRLETMILTGSDMPLRAVRGQIASSIDLVIQLGRLRDHSRRVVEITELLGCRDDQYQLNPIFRFEEEEEVMKKEDYFDSGRGIAAGILKEETGPGAPGADARVHGHLVRTGNSLQDRRKLRSAALESDEI